MSQKLFTYLMRKSFFIEDMAISFFIHQLNKCRNLYTNISKHNNNALKGQMIFKRMYIPENKTWESPAG